MENAVAINTKITDKIQTAATGTAAQKSADKALHKRFAKYGKNAKKWTQKCKLLLPKIAKYRIWEKKGFENIYEYARILAGMSRASVDDALWVGRKIENIPALQQIAEEKGINAVRPIVAIATSETADFWADKIKKMSVHTLETYVKEFKKLVHVDKNYYENQDLFPDIKTETIQMEISAPTADELRKLKGAGDWDELMQKFIALYKEKLEAEKPAPIENASRYVPTAIKKHALAKTNGTCAFPGCTRPHEILHHTKRYALTHAHDPDKLAPLCKTHERLAHLGLIENEEVSPNEWRLRMQPDRADKKYKIDQKVLKYRSAFG